MGEEIFVKLRDCFTAGYTLPQFCIDNGIKNPLFVSEKRFELFLWEIYVQFYYDKRISAHFCFIDSERTLLRFNAHGGLISALRIKNISEVTFDDFDKIIFLTEIKSEEKNNKIIHLPQLEKIFISRTYCDIPLVNFLQRYPKVKLILTNFPSYVSRYEGGAEFSKNELKGLERMRKILRANKSGTVKTLLDKFGYTNEEVLELMEAPIVRTNPDGSTIMEDNDHPLIRIKNNKRMTAYQPEKFLSRIYFVGTCHEFGVNAPFDKTIASYLQKMLNENNLPYRVENESQRYFNRYQDIFYNLNKLTPAPGDIIFVSLNNLRSKNFPSINLMDGFDPPHDFREIFCVSGHVNELGYKIVAEKYFDYLTKNNFFRDVEFKYPSPSQPVHRYGIPPQYEQGGAPVFVNEELETYKQTLRAKKLPIGALVMNCNPFTLGHQYLVEYAAAQVVKLYVFVVEEDKSEFPFADRIELVKQGVKHLPNVEVLPSGKFIISQQTFSGYFNKAKLQDVSVDSSEDVEIFGREIAPTLGITIRFAGEEPIDNVTRQYNETMKEILPRYGVEFREIPRKTFGDEVISASKVRAALKRGDFDKIKNFVPSTTLLYLRERFANSSST